MLWDDERITNDVDEITLTIRRTPLQTQALAAIGVNTRTWDKATITQS